jgi:hypothetical protein
LVETEPAPHSLSPAKGGEQRASRQWLVSLAHTQDEMAVLVSDFRDPAQALRA